MRRQLFLLLLITFSILQAAYAQWNPNPSVNTPVSTGATKQVTDPHIVSDGNGGYYITWSQMNDGTYGLDVYLQHLDPNGNALWTSNGIVVCNAALNQGGSKILNDGNGGVFVVWADCRTGFANHDIYAQHYNSAGTALWPANGLQITDQPFSDEFDVQLVSDDADGMIICWWKATGGGLQTDVYAQRVNTAGNILWTATTTTGVPVCIASNRQELAKMVSDGNGGVIIAWNDFRNNPTVPDIYAQRIDANGLPMWILNGIPICALPYDQAYPQLISDGNGGAIITWTDFRASTSTTNVLDIYAQRINPAGITLWDANGIVVCDAATNQQEPFITEDDEGGAIISWYDERTPSGSIYCQRISPNGNPQWTANGILVCSMLNNFTSPFIVKDGNKGAFLVWQDRRNGIANDDIYAQHIIFNGSAEWTANGVPICNAAGGQVFLRAALLDNGWMISDNDGSAVLAWLDQRVGNSDLYATKIIVKPPVPVVLNVNDKCTSSPTARGKLANPPYSATISVKQDGIPLTYDPADSSFQYFITSVTTAGNHTVTVEYTNAAGTSSKDTIYIVSASPAPSITIQTLSTTICTGTLADFTATASGAGSSPSYQWQLNGGDIGSNSPTWSSSTLQNGDIISCVLTIDPSLTCATASSAVSNTLEMTVTTADPPSVTISSSETEICPGTMVQFTATALNSGASPVYQWKLNGVNTGTNNPVYSSSNLTDGDEVYCIITPGNGSCSNAPISSDEIMMTVHFLPDVIVSPVDTVIVRNSQVQLTGFYNSNASSHTWSSPSGSGLSDPSTLTPVTAPLAEDAIYLLTVTTPYGCEVQKTISIKILNGLFIPNAFTPDGNGRNDIFRIPPYSLHKLKRFSVYNRWGNMIFTTTDLNAGWDGTFKGIQCDTGTYVYAIEGFDGIKNVFLKGTITLIR